MNRNQRAKLAQETLEILKNGFYHKKEGKISLQTQIEQCIETTKYFTPEELDTIVAKVLKSPKSDRQTKLEICNETTLQGTERLAQRDRINKIVALNFASAKNPGGGFLSGSMAQEESLARSSALYPSLCQAPEYYEKHRRDSSCLYSHRMILSPNCPVFRNDSGELLAQPYQVTFITSPAPNLGALVKHKSADVDRVAITLKERATKVLALAVRLKADAIVLGAWGCGVFGNNPHTVASTFKDLLQDGGKFARRFPRVLFSVLDNSPGRQIYQEFALVLKDI